MNNKKATDRCNGNECCCNNNGVHNAGQDLNLDGAYICYCDKVTKDDIKKAVEEGASTVKEAIKVTGAMQHCNCTVNNPKGRCCMPEFTAVFTKYYDYDK